MNRPFDIDVAMDRIREAVRPYPKAAMFELRDIGFGTVFHQLVGCMLSIRTRDEVSFPTSVRLFQRAPTPADVAALSHEELDELIRACSFHEGKTGQIQEIAKATVDRFCGELPADYEVLTSFRGVGPKCANLALGVAAGQAKIAVDVHVHRITNRWGYVTEPTPEETMVALERELPERYHVEINALLVPFGKNICTARNPHCDTCVVRDMCARVGVKTIYS